MQDINKAYYIVSRSKSLNKAEKFFAEKPSITITASHDITATLRHYGNITVLRQQIILRHYGITAFTVYSVTPGLISRQYITQHKIQ